ncbi:MAG: replicative DNA helicase [Propionibacteriaceae bacterium]|jgi:replicative DNA helicase|nr:replicative DNA helicase [Propionibacteriaceae bacterium]
MSIAPLMPYADEDYQSDRVPPQDVGAEQSVLGCMMLSQEAISDVSSILKPGDFYRPAHEQIYLAIVDLFGHGEPVDAITVANELTKRGELAKVGGHIYIHELLETVSIASNASYYAEIVHEKATLRQLLTASTHIAQSCYSERGDVSDIVDEAQQAIFSVGESENRDELQPLSDLMFTTMEEMENLSKNGNRTGIPTGFTDLDELTNGLQPGQMIIIAARPSIGKSTLGLDFARNAAIHNNLCTAFFSLEMTKSEIVMKLLSAEAQISLGSIRKGMLDGDHWQRLAQVSSKVSQAPLYIDDSPNLTMMEIRAKARRLKQQHDLKLVVVDYLQLLSSGKKVESRQVEVSEFSRQMKLLAKELQVPVIALSQLNRGPEQQGTVTRRNGEGEAQKVLPPPKLSHLRESGSLEQDADIVILLHREDFYDKNQRPGEADLILAKHRNGPTATITVTFQGHYSRFHDMAKSG